MPRLELVALCSGCLARRRTIWKSTAAGSTTHTWCALEMAVRASTMIASIFSSLSEEAPKVLLPVRWCCRSWPVASGHSSRAAPAAAGVRPIVPQASANMIVFWSSGRGRQHGDVG